MSEIPIRVDNCPLCSIFLNPRENIRTKLYYPDSIDKVPESDFVILDCKSCREPMIVLSEHMTDISKELWGRILRECRILFGKSMRLRTKMHSILDHLHYHLM